MRPKLAKKGQPNEDHIDTSPQGSSEWLEIRRGRITGALRRLRCLHIAGWEHDAAGRQSLAVYAIGRKPDARRTAPRTRAQIARDYRARAKAARLLGLMKETA